MVCSFEGSNEFERFGVNEVDVLPLFVINTITYFCNVIMYTIQFFRVLMIIIYNYKNLNKLSTDSSEFLS